MLALKNPSYLMGRTPASLKRHPGSSRGHMSRQNCVLHFKKGALGSDGLFFENIKPRKCDPTLPKCLDEGSFIYCAPRPVLMKMAVGLICLKFRADIM